MGTTNARILSEPIGTIEELVEKLRVIERRFEGEYGLDGFIAELQELALILDYHAQISLGSYDPEGEAVRPPPAIPETHPTIAPRDLREVPGGDPMETKAD